MKIYQLDAATACNHHKRCHQCRGENTACLEIIKCSSSQCTNYCHTDCLAGDLRKDLADRETYFCSEACGQPPAPKSEVTLATLAAEIERVKRESAQREQRSRDTSMKAILELQAAVSTLQKSNRDLLAKNQNLLLLSSTKHFPADMSVFTTSADETQPFDSSRFSEKVQKTMEEIRETVNASSASNATTSQQPDDPFNGQSFDTAESASVEHAKASYILSLNQIRKNLGELPTFEGKGGAWLKFKSRYAKIQTVGKYSDVDMLEKLEKALKGQALDYVQAWIDSPNPSVAKIMSDLEERFYNVDTIMQEGLSAVMQVEQLRTWNRDQLEKYSRLVDTYIHLCTTVGHSIHLNGRLPGEAEDKLPDDLLRDWMKHKSGAMATGSWFEFAVFLKNSLKYLKVQTDEKGKGSKESKG